MKQQAQGRGGEWKGGALYYGLNVSQWYQGAVVHAPGKVPRPPSLAPEPAHQRGLSHGAHVTQGMQAESVQSCDFQVGRAQGSMSTG